MSALDIAAQAQALRSGAISAAELAHQARAKIAALQAGLNALITDCEAESAAAAAEIDAFRLFERAPLAGIPLVHKDNFCTEGTRTTCGSRMLADFVPPYDATVVAKLRGAGAVYVGKSNMDEFAMGSSNENSHFGAVRNPWDPTRVPGGSSGGSAALVAAGAVAFATGSDTGGSVRQPAAFCGVTGLKPSYGRVSRYGLVAYASSLDQAGVLARSAADCATVLGVLAGHDPRDATSATAAVPDYAAALAQPLAGLRVGVVKEFFGAGVEDGVGDACRAALAELERAGARLVDVSLPSLVHAIPAYYVIAPAEASSNLARFDGMRYGHRAAGAASVDELIARSRDEGFGAEVKRRILTGTYVLSAGYYDAYYVRAQRVRRLIAQDFARAFESCDLLAGPTAPTVAFPIGQKTSDPLAMYAADINTVAVNLAGLPAISIPAGFAVAPAHPCARDTRTSCPAQDLPVGLQLIAPVFEEARLLGAAHQFQMRSDWHQRMPPECAGS